MKKIVILILFCLLPSIGCQWGGQRFGTQPYAQSFPADAIMNQGGLPQIPNLGGPITGARAASYVGGLADGFVRSAVGGAGLTAGRDLWRSIVD